MASRETCREEVSMRRQGSVRRVVHDGSGIGVAARTLSPPSPPSPYPVFSNFMQEYSIIYEFNAVCDQCIPGLYVIPSAKCPLVWFGVVFVRDGPYRGGVFRFTLFLPEGFPSTSSPPRVVLEGRTWHPNVELETGEVELGLDWAKGKRLREALSRLASLLSSPDTTIAANPHARNMYESDREEFERLAREWSERGWEELLLESGVGLDDPHYLHFEAFQPLVHQPTLAALKETPPFDPKNLEWLASIGAKKGLTWVAPGSLCPFSKLVT